MLLGWAMAVLLVLMTCTPSGTTTPTITPVPALTITAPANGTSLPAGDIAVKTSATNFNVVDKQRQPKVAGEGHVHFYLDIDAPTALDVATAPAIGTWAHVSGTSYTFTNVATGTHTISVQMVNNDHPPLIPLVIQKITITVTASASTTPTPALINTIGLSSSATLDSYLDDGNGMTLYWTTLDAPGVSNINGTTLAN